jgi:adenine-specific DNA-methyltransferase
MRYFGSKVSTVAAVYNLISQRVPQGALCDPFGGVATVGSYFKARGYSVWTGDILMAAHYFQIARVELSRTPSFRRLREALNLKSRFDVIDLLNRENPKNGWFTREFSEKRQFFTRDNARRIEACRLRISQWARSRLISRNEKAILLASLINSMDKVANTAGTYYAYLKSWHRKALLPFRYELLPCTYGNPDCHCFHGEARELVTQRAFDILYLDLPYNERSYTNYYHLPETLALEETPRAIGMSGVPDNPRIISDFNKRDRAKAALEKLLEKSSFRLLAFHYSDNGLIEPHELRCVFREYGRIEEFIINSKGYTTATTSRTVEHRLYLVNHG